MRAKNTRYSAVQEMMSGGVWGLMGIDDRDGRPESEGEEMDGEGGAFLGGWGEVRGGSCVCCTVYDLWREEGVREGGREGV